jgi:hypothetical protein
MTKTKHFVLRLTPELYKLIEGRAKKNLRSVNSELVILLKLGLGCDIQESKSIKRADELIEQANSEPNQSIQK